MLFRLVCQKPFIITNLETMICQIIEITNDRCGIYEMSFEYGMIFNDHYLYLHISRIETIFFFLQANFHRRVIETK